MIDLLGYIGGALGLIAFVPQVWRIWRRRSADDISMPTFIILVVAVVCAGLYGLLIHAYPIAATNAVALVLYGAILWMKLRFRKQQQENNHERP